MELCVVGEPILDPTTQAYLDALNGNFPVPLTDRSVKI